MFKKLWEKLKAWWQGGKPALKVAIFALIDAVIKPAIIKALRDKKQEIISNIQNFSEQQNADKWCKEAKDLIERQL
jgi:hypothetical protein